MALREVHRGHHQHFQDDRVAVGLELFALMPARALAHCDGLDGPVVKAAQRALELPCTSGSGNCLAK